MKVNMKMSGTEEFHAALRALPDGVRVQVLQNAVEDIAKGMTNDIVANVPVRTGTLRDSYVWEMESTEGFHKSKAQIGTTKDGFYWHWVEFGRPNMSAKPYVRPAFDRWRRKSRRIIRKHFEAALGVAMRKARRKK